MIHMLSKKRVVLLSMQVLFNKIKRPDPCSSDQLTLKQAKTFFVARGYESSIG